MASAGPNPDGFVHRRLRILVPLRHHDFRLLWCGMTVSLLGDGITTIALAWQAYEISNVATAFSMVMFSMAVPQVVLLLVGGVVSDRFERRKVMLFADLVRMVAVFALGLLSLYGNIQIWHMMVIAAFYGAGTAFFGPAFDAIVPDLVPAPELTQANALDQFVRPAAYRMVGPALGGWLIALLGTPGDAFLVDGVTFSISVACLILMRHRPTTSTDDAQDATSVITEIKEGLAYVRTQTWLWGTFLAATLAYLIFWGPAEVLLPLRVKNDLGGSAGELGVILALGGVGAMVTAVVMGNRSMPRRHMTFMYVVWTVSTLAIAGYGLARLPWQAMVFCFAFNALEAAGLIVWITTKQRLVPQRLMGRVSSFDWFISTALVPVSYALTGPVAKALGTQPTLIAAGCLGAVVTLAFLFVPGMRTIERSGVLAGVHLESALEPTLDAEATPGAEPPSASPAAALTLVGAPVGEALAEVALALGSTPRVADGPRPAAETTSIHGTETAAGDAFATLAALRDAIDRWKRSRDVVEDRIATLEAKETALVAELTRLRERLAVARANRATVDHGSQDLAAAGPRRRAG